MSHSHKDIDFYVSMFEEVQEGYKRLQNSDAIKQYSNQLDTLTDLFEETLQNGDYEMLFELERLAMDRDRQIAEERGMSLNRRPDPYGIMDSVRNLWKVTSNKKTFERFYKATLSAYPTGKAPYDQFGIQINQLKRQIGVFAGGETNESQYRHYTTRTNCLSALVKEHKRRVEGILKKKEYSLSR